MFNRHLSSPIALILRTHPCREAEAVNFDSQDSQGYPDEQLGCKLIIKISSVRSAKIVKIGVSVCSTHVRQDKSQ